MVYSFLLQVAHRNVQLSRSTQCVLQTCKRMHSRLPIQTANTATSRPVLLQMAEHSSAVYKWSCIYSRDIYVDAMLRNKRNHGEKNRKVTVSKGQSSPPGLSATQKVKEAGKDFTYLIVVLIGLGVTGGLLYVVFQELFSSSSPSKVYGKAFEKCRRNPEVIGAFGEPIKGFGETSRRGRRQQVSHVEYMKDGLKHMRLKFYIEGSEPGRQGTVHSESKENPETGKYEFRYIFVDVDTYPRRTIVIEDNR